MAEKIYIRNASGKLEPLEEKAFETEALLQELIGQHPELLAGEQMHPDDPLHWILVRREMPIKGWAIDHLLLDQDARPTLVEVKRGASSDNRRKVVGQMLDYAATAAGVWSGDGMRRAFEEGVNKRGADPLEELRKLLQPDDETDAEDLADEFWERAATNLAANRLRLLFVADEIPVELERVVRFLNEHTRDNLEVLAVEVKQYPGQFGQALVSRVIGETDQETQRSSSAVARKEAILERCSSPAVREALQSLTDAAAACGATVQWATVGVSIRQRCSLLKTGVFVARFRWGAENDHLPLELFVQKQESHPFPQELRSILQKWIDKFKEDDFVVPHTKFPNEAEGWMATEDNFAQNVGIITERLVKTLQEIKAL